MQLVSKVVKIDSKLSARKQLYKLTVESKIAYQIVIHINPSRFLVFALELDVRMPSIPAVPDIDDIYLCTSVPLPDPDQTFYATSFYPKATKKFVHHFVVYGCSEPSFPNNGFKTFYLNFVYLDYTVKAVSCCYWFIFSSV
jgi:hypothetical protein